MTDERRAPVVGAALLAAAAGVFAAAALRRFDGVRPPFENGFGAEWDWPEWAWTPFIHSPLWNLFIAGVQAIADALGATEADVVHGLGTLCAAACAGGVASRFAEGRWAWVAGLCTALCASSLRPFEEYPAARLLLLAAWVAFARLPRGSVSAAAATGWVAVTLHLSSWFLLGPAAALHAARVGRRGLVALGVLLAVFTASLFPSIVDVFATGPGHADWQSVPWVRAVTLEWTNPILFAPLLLLGSSRVRAAAPSAAAAAAGVVVFTAAHFALMQRGWAIGGAFDHPGWTLDVHHHHYFALIEPVVVLAGVSALRAWGGRRAWRAGVALVVAQAAHWGYGVSVLLGSG